MVPTMSRPPVAVSDSLVPSEATRPSSLGSQVTAYSQYSLPLSEVILS